MKARHATHGATLLVVVLLTMLLMGLVLVTTLRLGLTTRQNTADHKLVLQAQYGAESQVSLARSKLRDVQGILSATPGQPEHLKFPISPSVTTLDMETMALQFCGKVGVTNPWEKADEFNTPRTGNDTEKYILAHKCRVAAPTAINDPERLNAQTFTVLSRAVQPGAYAALPNEEKPLAGADVATLNTWWQKYLVKASGSDLKYAVSPLQVVQLNPYRYRYYLGVTEVNAAGQSGNASRYVKGNRTQTGDWWFELYVPSPFDYVNFMNKWPQASGGWLDSTIDGNYFTNEKPRLYDYSARVRFFGNMESVGCNAIPTVDTTDCGSKQPGFFRPATSGATTGTPELLNASFRTNALFSENKSPNFAASYIPLPKNGSNQRTAAQDLGLVVNAGETGLELVAGDASGNQLTNYDASNQQWQEPSPTYQYIRFKNDAYDLTRWVETTGLGYQYASAEHRSIQDGKYYLRPRTVVREYRVDKDDNLYQYTGGIWAATGRKFNGVIYTSGPLVVNGPARLSSSTTGDVSNMPPALASFSQMNVVGEQGLTVTGDLTLSDTPCNNQQIVEETCTKNTRDRMPQNVLGLFAPVSHVALATTTPDNVTLHAAIMTSSGGLSVERFSERPNQGFINVIGSVINDEAQSAGHVGNGGILHGYNNNYSYDNRFRYGILPPYPPIVMFWRAQDAKGAGKNLDNLIWRQASAQEF